MENYSKGSKKTRRLKLLGLCGVAGSLIAVIADVALGFNPDGIDAFDTVFSLSVRQVYPIFAETPHWRLVWSNYLAAIGIPVGFMGFIFIYRQIHSGSPAIERVFFTLGLAGYLAGTLFHVSLSYIATLFRLETETGESFSRLVALFTSFSQPLAYIFLTSILLVSLILAYLVFRGKTSFPPLFGFANPLSIQLLIAAVMAVAPPAVRTFLTISLYNLSLAIFYSIALTVATGQGAQDGSGI